MKSFPTLCKSLACLILAATVAPATSGAAPQQAPLPLPGDQPDLNSPQNNPANPPVIVIVDSDNVTVIKRVFCTYRQNVGDCLDTGITIDPAEFVDVVNASDYDSNNTCTLLSGRAKTGSYLGPFATANLNYDYYDLYIESNLKLRADEL